MSEFNEVKVLLTVVNSKMNVWNNELVDSLLRDSGTVDSVCDASLIWDLWATPDSFFLSSPLSIMCDCAEVYL